MQPALSALPGYQLYEYLLVINPGEDLTTRIQKIKDGFANTYQSSGARWMKPRLALLSFTQLAMMEERIFSKIKLVTMAQYPFKIELKDYGSLPSHSIYINVSTKSPVQELLRKIRQETQRLLKLDDTLKPHFMMEPQITIARKLLPWQYEKAWLEYSNRHFSGGFIANHLLLLKRPKGDLQYQIAARFEFENLPVATKQGALFGDFFN